jgi:hypothetical protein
MKVFNIYYNNEKLNHKPLTNYEVNGIKEKNFILKKDKDNRIVKIPLENVKIIKCTLI